LLYKLSANISGWPELLVSSGQQTAFFWDEGLSFAGVIVTKGGPI